MAVCGHRQRPYCCSLSSVKGPWPCARGLSESCTDPQGSCCCLTCRRPVAAWMMPRHPGTCCPAPARRSCRACKAAITEAVVHARRHRAPSRPTYERVDNVLRGFVPTAHVQGLHKCWCSGALHGCVSHHVSSSHRQPAHHLRAHREGSHRAHVDAVGGGTEQQEAQQWFRLAHAHSTASLLQAHCMCCAWLAALQDRGGTHISKGHGIR